LRIIDLITVATQYRTL